MSEQKYSIDEILREAAKLRADAADRSLLPSTPPAAAESAAAGQPAPKPQQGRPRVVLRVKPAVIPTRKRTVAPPQGAPEPQGIPLGRTVQRTEAAPPAQSFIRPQAELQTAHRQTQPSAQQRVPVYIPPEPVRETPSAPAQPMLPTEQELLAEIYAKKSLYSETRNRATPRPDYTPRHITATPSFRTPDANRSEPTRIIDAQALRKIQPVPPRDAPPRAADRFAKTQVIDPKEFERKPDFRFIKDVGTVKTAHPETRRATGALPAIEATKNYADDFRPTPRQPSRPRSPVSPPQRSFAPPPAMQQPVKPPMAPTRGTAAPAKRQMEHTAIHTPPVIERPALFRGRTKFQKTADLQEIPEILSVEEYQTLAAARGASAPMPKVEEYDYAPNQLRLEGFEGETENIATIDETEAEEQLLERRREKVGHFKLFGSHQEETAEPQDYFEFGEEEDDTFSEPIDDYHTPADREAIFESLAAKERKLSVRMLATGAVTICMLFFNILQAIGTLPALLSNAHTMLTLFSIMAVLVLFFNLSTFWNGLRGLFRFRPDADFPLTITTLFVVAQLVYAYFTPDLILEGLPIYPFALAFAYLCNDIGKQTLLRRVRANFEFLTAGGEKYTVQDIEDPRDTQAICQGLLMGDPVVKHSVRTGFPTDFLQIAYAQEPADTLCRKLTPVMTLLSIVLGTGAYLMHHSLSLAISAAACAACISMPVVSLLASNTALLSLSRKIKSNGAMVNGFHGAEQTRDANAIIFDAADLFPGGSCDLHGIKTFGGMRVDDAILQTAAVIINAKGPLQDVFDKVIVGKQSILPEVEGLVYEERMGSSAWIYGKKILVGNRQLLLHHGVQVPPEGFEAKYKHDGRYLLYLTVGGKIAAMFVVSYHANDRVKEELARLEKSGMTVLVRTSDPNIDEEMLTTQYELDEGFLRVLSSASSRIYKKYSDHSVETYPAYIVHNGSAIAFISAMYASDVLWNLKNILNIVQIFGTVLGMGLAVLFALFGGLNQLGALSVVLFQCVWSALVLLISKYKK